MAHGMFKLKVVKITNDEVMYEYAACVAPQKGETLIIDGRRLAVGSVNHILKSGRDGGGEWFSLDYVEVRVCK